MIIMRVNGERVPLELGEDEDIAAFVKEASSDEIVALITRCVQLGLEAGLSDAEVQTVVTDITLQLGALRGDVTLH